MARTLVVDMVVAMEVFYLVKVRFLHMASFHWRGVLGTPAVLRALTVVVVAQFAFTDLPAMQAVFDTRPVAFTDGWLIMGAGMAIMIVLESEKIVMRRVGRRY